MVLIRCSVVFRLKSISGDLREIKRVAFQSAPAVSTLTKVMVKYLDGKRMKEQKHQALSRHEKVAFRDLSQLHI